MNNTRRNSMKSKRSVIQLIPILFSFFVMGFVDVVGISTSYVKTDFGLSDTLANLLPMMVFLWFAICSLPTGLLMGKIGRKRTVLLSALITCIAMLIPLISYTFITVLLAFALLGIGNTILQVSLNPLLMDVVAKEKVTSTLTFGYFIKAISSTLGPVLAGVAASAWGSWQLIFPVYALATFLSWIWLVLTPIKERNIDVKKKGSIGELLGLFRSRFLLISFTVILLSVGFEVGLMTAVPKYFLERCSIPIEQGGLGCSLYFAARTIGTFVGVFMLLRISSHKFLIVNLIIGILSFIIFMIMNDAKVLSIALFGIGFFCANIFPITLSAAIQFEPKKTNEISALMIMGVAGGAILPVIMGMVADVSNQCISLLIPLMTLLYILFATFYLKTQQTIKSK